MSPGSNSPTEAAPGAARTGGGWPLWATLAAALLLTALAGVFVYRLARAPDDHVGRALVFFEQPLADREAYLRLAAGGAEPIRLMTAADGWVVEVRDAGGVGRLRTEHGASWVLRDIGMGRTLAGCLALVRAPAERKPLQP